jgi:hypothetical protein
LSGGSKKLNFSFALLSKRLLVFQILLEVIGALRLKSYWLKRISKGFQKAAGSHMNRFPKVAAISIKKNQ